MKQAMLCMGLFLAPIAWFVSLEANFALAPLACNGHGKNVVWLVSTVALGMATVSGLLSWTQRKLDHQVAISGTILSSLFAIAIVVQAIPNLLLGGCE